MKLTLESSATSGGNPVQLAPGAVGLGITCAPTAIEYKTYAIVATIITRICAGRYANLSTFDIYGDNMFKIVKMNAFQLLLSGSPAHLAGYPKVRLCVCVWSEENKKRNNQNLLQLG